MQRLPQWPTARAGVWGTVARSQPHPQSWSLCSSTFNQPRARALFGLETLAREVLVTTQSSCQDAMSHGSVGGPTELALYRVQRSQASTDRRGTDSPWLCLLRHYIIPDYPPDSDAQTMLCRFACRASRSSCSVGLPEHGCHSAGSASFQPSRCMPSVSRAAMVSTFHLLQSAASLAAHQRRPPPRSH